MNLNNCTIVCVYSIHTPIYTVCMYMYVYNSMCILEIERLEKCMKEGGVKDMERGNT